jgi:hypothetical protein
MTNLDAAGITWELIVVDNAGEPTTEKTCESFSDRLPLRYLVCTAPGKNAALNRGLPVLRGDLVLFTDDDVLPENCWLQETVRGASRWPEHLLFGGRIMPEWPPELRHVDLDPAWGRWTYGICDPGLAEGPHSRFLPLGANMAVRRVVFKERFSFNETIGPNGQSYAMGSETELILRLQRSGHDAVFLPGSLVLHVILPWQLHEQWLVHRAFRQGRGEARLNGDLSWYNVMRLAKHAGRATLACYGKLPGPGRPDNLRKRLACSLTQGRLYEALQIKLGLR